MLLCILSLITKERRYTMLQSAPDVSLSRPIVKSNSTIVDVRSTFGKTEFPPDLKSLDPSSYRVCTNKTMEQVFFIDQDPIGQGYITMQLWGANPLQNQMIINDVDFGNNAICCQPSCHDYSHIWTEVIDSGILRKGKNTIKFIKNERFDDFFVIDYALIDWREVEKFNID